MTDLADDFPDSLMQEHMDWHRLPNDPQSIRRNPLGSAGSGLEFFSFHTQFMTKVFSWWYSDTNDTFPGATWSSVPTAMQTDDFQSGWIWNGSAGAKRWVDQILNNPFSFPTADALGQFLEANIHMWLHMKAFYVYNDQYIPNISMSPKSALFYGIHRLMNYWRQRWYVATQPPAPPDPCQVIRDAINDTLDEIAGLQASLQSAGTEEKPTIIAEITAAQQNLAALRQRLQTCSGPRPRPIKDPTTLMATVGQAHTITAALRDTQTLTAVLVALHEGDHDRVHGVFSQHGVDVTTVAYQDGVLPLPPATRLALYVDGHYIGLGEPTT